MNSQASPTRADADETPRLDIDLGVLRRRYEATRAAFPFTRVCFAVKANATAEVVGALSALGCGFDIYSAEGARLCRDVGGDPALMYYDRLDAPEEDVAAAYAAGVRRFSVGSPEELERLAPIIPGAEVLARVKFPFRAAPYKRWQTLGADAGGIAGIAACAAAHGLAFRGLNTHLGTQQLDVGVWEFAIGHMRRILDGLGAAAPARPILNLGGSLPIPYQTPVPSRETIAAVIEGALWRHFGDCDETRRPIVEIEPGRHLIGDAGVMWTRIESVEEGEPARLALGEAVSAAVFYQMIDYGIHYPIRLARDSDAALRTFVLKGRDHHGRETVLTDFPYTLPGDVKAGEVIRIEKTGAYCNFDLQTQNARNYTPLRFVDASERNSADRTRPSS